MEESKILKAINDGFQSIIDKIDKHERWESDLFVEVDKKLKEIDIELSKMKIDIAKAAITGRILTWYVLAASILMILFYG